MQSGMKHVSPSHICDSSNSPLSYTILMMGTHTTETYGLPKVMTVRLKFCQAKDTIVGVISLNGDANVCCFMFEEQFSINSVAGSSSKLMIDKEKATTMVDIYCATGVPIAR
jgi:hypothetical protein